MVCLSRKLFAYCDKYRVLCMIIEIDGGFKLIVLVPYVGIIHNVQLPSRAFLYVQFNVPLMRLFCLPATHNKKMMRW